MDVDDTGTSKLNVWEVGGEKDVRSSWDFYFANTEALVFVVDSSDHDRSTEAKETLHNVLKHQYFEAQRDLPLVVIANKQDVI
ncbi:ADP-ribosylation factor 2-like, partial [Anneissia japonica]|uniref:ADP-ribosylation factor 2-like n=1 Tax=Anneissia japonica TaxID=1529436 RepID=UPI0014258CF6